MRKAALTRAQREVLQTLSKGPEQKSNMKPLITALNDLVSKGAVWYSAGTGEASLTESGKRALESGYL